MTATIEDVLTAIGRAKPEELARIKAALRAREQFTPIPEPEKARNGLQAVADGVLVDTMLEAIIAVARASGLEFAIMQQLKRSAGYAAFRTKVQELDEYLKPFKANRIELRAFLELAVDLLFKNLADMGVAVSARTAMSHIHRLPAVVDKAFPGYYRAGMMKWIIKKDSGHVRKK